MRSPPRDLGSKRLREELAAGWGIRPATMDYVPEGGGSHHWRAVDVAGGRHFVTVDDLDDKDWLGGTRTDVFGRLGSAFGTAQALRQAGLDFVVAPVPARHGAVVRRLEDRYAISVCPFMAGHSFPFGVYAETGLRDRVLDMMADVHGATAAVRDLARRDDLRYGGQRDLNELLAEPERRWDAGPFSEPARLLFTAHLAELGELVGRFEQLADRTAAARVETVITHGEPHPANLMSVNGTVRLVDWDTAALAPGNGIWRSSSPGTRRTSIVTREPLGTGWTAP